MAYLKEQHPGVVTYRHDGGGLLGAGAHASANISSMEGGRCVGAPDLLILLRGSDGSGFLAVEFKSPAGRVQSQQLEAHARLREQQGRVHVVRSLVEFKRVLHGHTATESLHRREPLTTFTTTKTWSVKLSGSYVPYAAHISDAIEDAHQQGLLQTDVTLGDSQYTIDFASMQQILNADTTHKRCVRRTDRRRHLTNSDSEDEA